MKKNLLNLAINVKFIMHSLRMLKIDFGNENMILKDLKKY